MKLFLIVLFTYTSCAAIDSENNTKIQQSSHNFYHEEPFSYEVSIRSYDIHICGGAIINKRYILTLARCVVSHSPKWLHALLGAEQSSEHNHPVDINKIKTHEQYDLWGNKNIALLNTAQDIEFSYRIQPIKLALPHWIYNEDKEFTVSGWNVLEVRGEFLRFLHFYFDCKFF